MSFSVDLKQFLQTAATAAGQHVYNDHAPEGTQVPYIEVVQATNGQYYQHLKGSAPVANTIWHVYAYGPSRGTTDDLGEEVRVALDAYYGNMGPTFVHDITTLFTDAGTDRNQSKDYTPRYWNRNVFEVNHSVTEVSR